MCDNLSSSSKFEGSASPTSLGRISSPSREQSPDLSGNVDIFEQSVESSILSDSSEEGISLSEVLTCEVEADGKLLDGEANGKLLDGEAGGKLLDGEAGEHVNHDAEIKLQQQPMAEGKDGNGSREKKKKRLSSRRERKISLSSKIDGVKVQPLKEGYLLQQGSFQRWSKKYFALYDDKLYISKKEDENLREEIILKDMDVAENSSKNINHNFTVITPFHQVVVAASSRKEMEEWVGAFKVALSRSKHMTVVDTLEHLEGQHSWFSCTHSRPTYCNMCRDTLHGVAWHGLSCEVCKIKSHRHCVYKIVEKCKWTTRNSLQEAGVQLGQDLAIPHQWMEGNIPVGSKCCVCEKTCGSLRRLQDFRCLWCKWTVHTECKEKVEMVCTLGEHQLSILSPSALQRSDIIKHGMWEPYQMLGHSPVLACVNSKSGDNLGVKFLRKLKFWLNPTQVFDLAISGPDLGLQLFQRFEKFRVMVLGGDGSIGWVLSTIDKYNLNSKCMVGIVPLGTGNDMARVLGWGAQCREEEKLPGILSEMEQCSFKLLDRWSLQYTPEVDSTRTQMLADILSPLSCRYGGGCSNSEQHTPSPLPGPNVISKSVGCGAMSPGDSVFSHEDSVSSDEYKSVSEHTPSPEGSVSTHTTALVLPNSVNGDSRCGERRKELLEEVEDAGEEAGDSVRGWGSPQNTVKITELHKSLSDLACSFSTLHDKQNWLKSAELLGGVLKKFLSSVVSDIESEPTSSEFQDGPLVQHCVVLQEKLSSLVTNFKNSSTSEQEATPANQVSVQREQLLTRDKSLKKTLSNVIDVTERALDTIRIRAEELEEIKELTGEIGMQTKGRLSAGEQSRWGGSYRPSKDSISSMGSVVDPAPLLPEMKELAVMNNYFGLGLDAKIAYKFNAKREKNPSNYKSRTKNMMLYGILGGKEFLFNSQRYLERRIQLECDGEPVELPQRLQGLVFLNIPSYMAGTNFWGTEREKSGFCAPSHDDKLVEVVAVAGLTSIATAKVLGIQNHRLRQCRVAKVILNGPDSLPVQVDGEAWLQKPGIIIVSHKNKARMLVKDKAFSQTLESWKQKHYSSPLLPLPPVTCMLHNSFGAEDMVHYRELAANVPPLISYIKAESEISNDVLRDLIPYVSSVTQSLERIFLEGGLISDTANLYHLQDFERDLKSLVQEVQWFLNMERISPEIFPQLQGAVQEVDTLLRRLQVDNLSVCSSQIRRGSDTLLLVCPTQHGGDQFSHLPPHRERSAQLASDDNIQAINMAKRIGKEVELWGNDDVCQWLEGVGMGEYCTVFQQRFFNGDNLLHLKKTDLQDLGVTKVGHLTRFYRCLQALTKSRLSASPT